MSAGSITLKTPMRVQRHVSVPGHVVRLAPFAALALFVALRWSAIESPAPAGRAWLSAGIALGLGVVLLLCGLLPRVLRQPSAVLVTAMALVGGVLAAGAPAHDLKPRHWDELVSGIGSDLSSLPGIVTPYGGGDRWTQVVILAGAAGGLVLASALAFWPRHAAVKPGWPLLALIALLALAAVPAVVLEGGSAGWLGVGLFVLAAAYLAAERAAAIDVPVAVPVLASLAVLAAIFAPALDSRHPWLDYQASASSASAHGERFDWSQGYGPLHWPRTAHVVLSIKASRPSYWKAENLDVFDGLRWRAAPPGQAVSPGELAPGAAAHPNWVQTIKVTVRGMHSRQMITAGDASRIDGSTEGVAVSPVSQGTFVAKQALGKGDYYSATVYTPRPTPAQLSALGPAPETQDLIGERSLVLPVSGERMVVVFRAGQPPYAIGRTGDATNIVDRSSYARTYRLSQRLLATSTTPYDYVKAVQGYLSHGFTYTESPPVRRLPLESFLWRDKRGYCQQFAGAMALLLRMGGVPARVAVGFAPGRYDKQAGAWLVRDDEAHAWVEAWFPGIGWVTFDPTPAVAPALGQISTNREASAAGNTLSALNVANRLSYDPLSAGTGKTAVVPGAGRGAKRGGGGPSALAWVAIAFGVLAVAGGAAFYARRRRGGPGRPQDALVSELERALRRAGRPAGPGMTLRQIEQRFGAHSDAAAYVAAVRAVRYGASSMPPSVHQRRGLRRELSRGLGPLGLVRAWWAVPPRL